MMMMMMMMVTTTTTTGRSSKLRRRHNLYVLTRCCQDEEIKEFDVALQLRRVCQNLIFDLCVVRAFGIWLAG
jgi:hypothetical protein